MTPSTPVPRSPSGPVSTTRSVTVIIPAWNRAGWISESLDSVVAQTSAAAQVVVVDDGSDDDTAEIARRHRCAPTVITTTHRGVAAARNTGLEIATGDLVAFLDSDDLWLPRKLAAQLPVHCLGGGVLMSCTHYDVVDLVDGDWQHAQRRQAQGPLTLDSQRRGNRVGTTTVMIDRAAALAAGGFDESLVRGSDFDLWLRMVERAPIEVVPEVLAVHRRHPDRLTGVGAGRDEATFHEVLAHRRHDGAASSTPTTGSVG